MTIIILMIKMVTFGDISSYQNGDSVFHLFFQLNEVSGQLEKAAHSEEKLEVKL